MKYQYGVNLWGGFFNDEHYEIHKKESGNFVFDSKEDRETFISDLKAIEKRLNAKVLMTSEYEGYLCHEPIILHRISKFDGVEVHTTRELFRCEPYSSCEYMLEYKWYLGFNDYPFGEEFDYENNEVESVSWIEGRFEYKSDI
jgi:hypothetical protein